MGTKVNPSLIMRVRAACNAFHAHPPDKSSDDAERTLEHYRAMLFRPASHVRLCELGRVDPAPVDDEGLVRRIIAAYQASGSLDPDQGSFWSDHFSGRKAPIHAALMRGDLGEVSTLLRNPLSNDLFYGFDGLCTGSGTSRTWIGSSPRSSSTISWQDWERPWVRSGSIIRKASRLTVRNYPPSTRS